jgi:hypothetical protein
MRRISNKERNIFYLVAFFTPAVLALENMPPIVTIAAASAIGGAHGAQRSEKVTLEQIAASTSFMGPISIFIILLFVGMLSCALLFYVGSLLFPFTLDNSGFLAFCATSTVLLSSIWSWGLCALGNLFDRRADARL